MKTTLILAIAVGSLAGVSGRFLLRGDARYAGPFDRPPVSVWPDRVATNGVVEGARPEVGLRPEGSGIIAAVRARENQDVTRGDVLVELRNETQKEQVALAKADLTVAKADLERLKNGERKERREALAATANARHALFLQAEGDWKRTQKMAATRSVSQEQYDSDYYKMMRAKSEYEQADAERALAEAPPRSEDVAAAEGRVAAAEARLRLAGAELAKTRLTAPTDGRVLHLNAEVGETTGPASPQPVIIFCDLSSRRIRAFVEELDVARVRAGQKAVVTADGLPGREFAGTVAVVVSRMGKRAVLSDGPGEYKDLYYREVLIDLDGPADDLPTNLRVQTRIEVGGE